MDPLYSDAEIREWLVTQRQARRLTATSPELPSCLREHPGESYLLPVCWRGWDDVVVYLRAAYPDVPPLIFLPGGTPRERLIPHVNQHGEVCCLAHETVINPFRPVEVIESVLKTARGLLEREYTLAELRAEVLPELRAYWHPSETPCWLLSPSMAERHTLLQVFECSKPAPAGVARIVPIDGLTEKGALLAVVIDLDSDATLRFIQNPTATAFSLASWPGSLTTVGEFLRRYPRTKRLRVGILARCQTDQGIAWLGGYFDRQLHLAKNRPTGFAEAAQTFLSTAKFVRCDVQDISTDRLLRRSAGEKAASQAERRLTLIGCGSLGGFLIDVLARHGFGRLLLIDKEVLHPSNLARHVLGWPWLYRHKAEGLMELLRQHLPETAVGFEPQDFREQTAWKRLVELDAALTIMATGDTNSELTLSRHCTRGDVGACVFTWLEPNLVGAHLIYQPRGGRSLECLHEDNGAGRILYKNRLVENPDEFIQREAGCQTSFTPFAGSDVALFAAEAARQVLTWLENRPTKLTAFRWRTRQGWEELVVPA
jgi:hypothetical protein